jgi:hypothetical protein
MKKTLTTVNKHLGRYFSTIDKGQPFIDKARNENIQQAQSVKDSGASVGTGVGKSEVESIAGDMKFSPEQQKGHGSFHSYTANPNLSANVSDFNSVAQDRRGRNIFNENDNGKVLFKTQRDTNLHDNIQKPESDVDEDNSI